MSPQPPRSRQPRPWPMRAGEPQTPGRPSAPAATRFCMVSLSWLQRTEASSRASPWSSICWGRSGGRGCKGSPPPPPPPPAPHSHTGRGALGLGGSFPETRGLLRLCQAHRPPRGEASCPIRVRDRPFVLLKHVCQAPPDLPATFSVPGSPGRGQERGLHRRLPCPGHDARWLEGPATQGAVSLVLPVLPWCAVFLGNSGARHCPRSPPPGTAARVSCFAPPRSVTGAPCSSPPPLPSKRCLDLRVSGS